MSRTTHLYIQLKQTDLDSMSALEALRDFLHVKEIVGLRRIRQVSLNWSEAPSQMVLNRILTQSYLLVNPNKETYSLKSPKSGGATGHTVHVAVSPSDPISNQRLVQKLVNRFNAPLTSIEHAIIWEITVDSQVPLQDVQTVVKDRILNSKSFRQGLLINPLFQTAVFQ